MELELKKGRYILAVSGGVDSVVLLELASRLPGGYEFVVAHFDHGIRPESAADAQFVMALAGQKNLPFYTERAELGHSASEESARTARYKFLRRIKRQTGATAIVTAHHKDDLLETIVMHLLRGTGRHGLDPMRRTPDVVRPLLGYYKKELHDYAKLNGLIWREDSTNNSPYYKRNVIRKTLQHAPAHRMQKLYELYLGAVQCNDEIDIQLQAIQKWAQTDNKMNRGRFVVLPFSVQCELVYDWLHKNGITEVQKQLIYRVVLAIKTGRPGSLVDLHTERKLKLGVDQAEIL